MDHFKKIVFCFLALQFSLSTVSLADLLTIDGPDYQGQSLVQIVESRGFQAETYDVISDGGYITTVTRVINPKANLSSITRTVVMHHGVFQSNISPQLSLCIYVSPQTPQTNSNSSDYEYDDDTNSDNGNADQNILLNESSILDSATLNLLNLSNIPQRIISNSTKRSCLAYYLSNSNYDVWLLEARGSTPDSSRHVNESISSEDYWNFDVHDQAINDVPAQIAKVKEISGRDKVAYISYSQSTAFMFILLSVNPQFASENLTAFVAVAPVAYNEHTSGLLRIGWDLTTAAPGFVTNNLNQPFPVPYETGLVLTAFLDAFCEIRLLADTICRAFVNFIVGNDDFNNILNLPFFSRLLSQTSFKGYIQLGQWTKPQTFNQFDYKDPELNMEHYGQETAPEYNLTNINFDRIIFVRSEQNDFLSEGSDQQAIIDRLPVPLYRDIVVPPTYDHFSYWVASSSFEEVIKPVKEALDDVYSSQ